jgi:hypothetical protein
MTRHPLWSRGVSDNTPAIRRRSLLQLAGLVTASAVVGTSLSGCGADRSGAPAPSPTQRDSATPGERPTVLLAYFSRAVGTITTATAPTCRPETPKYWPP